MSINDRLQPIHDSRELKLLQDLTKEYEKYRTPGMISKVSDQVGEYISSITPEKAKRLVSDGIDAASEAKVIQKAIQAAGQGFQVVQEHCAEKFLNKKSIIDALRIENKELKHFEHICCMRSYSIEKVCNKKKKNNLMMALCEGAATGAPGLYGVPFNIALSFLLYFRASQLVALHYGYDVENDPRELEFASNVTITTFSPNIEDSAENLSGLIGKMMLAGEFTALKTALQKNTYQQMAEAGGAQLLYTQIRALANKAAQKALEKSGKESLEGSMLSGLLKILGSHMGQEAGKKAIPIIGAVVGGLSDTYYMNKVFKGANLIYHKRFLFEKEQRIAILDL